MFELGKASCGRAYAAYKSYPAFFPLIGAVLLGDQEGVAYADQARAPRQVYVEHAFGFAQIFGDVSPPFEAALQHYLLVDRQFRAAKVRLYTPHLPAFLRGPDHAALRSERQRCVLDAAGLAFAESCRQAAVAKLSTTTVDVDNVAAVDGCFGVIGRFWRSADEFVANAQALVAWIDDQPAAICYAAAVANGVAEIDVLTLPEFRRTGLGRHVVTLFCQDCLARGLRPVWDCFTNNSGSMALGQAVGFVPARAPYAFFTINR